MSFSDGFVTGLANKLSEGIDSRVAKAEEYFARQLEIAQTTGLKNRNKVQKEAANAKGYAQKLLGMGVPKDIIMSQAASDPSSLADFYDQVDKLNMEAGGSLDSETYRSLWTAMPQYANSDEDFNSFFKRLYEPMKSAATEDPDNFRRDPAGSVFSRMFALNAMEGANKKLDKTEIIDGMSARDLLQYGDGYEVNVDPNAGLKNNYEGFNALAKELESRKGGKALTVSQRNSVVDTTNEHWASAEHSTLLKQKVTGEDGVPVETLLEAKNKALESLSTLNPSPEELEIMENQLNFKIRTTLRAQGMPDEKINEVLSSAGIPTESMAEEVIDNEAPDAESVSDVVKDPSQVLEGATEDLDSPLEGVTYAPWTGILRIDDSDGKINIYKRKTPESPDQGFVEYTNVNTGEVLKVSVEEDIRLTNQK